MTITISIFQLVVISVLIFYGVAFLLFKMNIDKTLDGIDQLVDSIVNDDVTEVDNEELSNQISQKIKSEIDRVSDCWKLAIYQYLLSNANNSSEMQLGVEKYTKMIEEIITSVNTYHKDVGLYARDCKELNDSIERFQKLGY